MQAITETVLDPMSPRPVRVERLWDETHDTFSMELTPEGRGMSFDPGQFNMVYAFGVGESALSISGDPTVSDRLVHTVRRVGTVTSELSTLSPGDVVGVRGPFGSAWPLGEVTGRDLIVVAGGIGLAPLRPVLYRVLADRDSYQRVALLYGTRSAADVLYEEELHEWGGRFDFDVRVTVDHAGDEWFGPVGVVTKLISRAPVDFTEALAFVCGPEIMMRFSARELVQRGVEPGRIWLSMERAMKCGIAFCGHCQFGPLFVCREGPVVRYDRVEPWLGIQEV